MQKINRSFGLLTLAIVGCYFLQETESRPGTNFASSSITSDGSGTRSSNLIGTIPDSNSNYSPSTRLGSSSVTGGGGGGSTIVTSNRGASSSGGAVISGTSSGNSPYFPDQSSGGNIIGIASRTGPSGTQHAIITSGGNQPPVLSRYGGSQTIYTPGQGGIGSVSSVPGASAGAFAGPAGSAAGSFAGHDYTEYDG